MNRLEDTILENALKSFSRKGFADSTIETIALDSGINKVTVFRHFKSKENLFQEVLDTYVRNIDFSAPDIPDDDTTEAGLDAICKAQMLWVFEHIHALRVEIQAGAMLKERPGHFKRTLEKSITVYLDSKDEYDPEDIGIVSEMLSCFVMWFALTNNKNHGLWEITDDFFADFEAQSSKNIAFAVGTLHHKS